MSDFLSNDIFSLPDAEIWDTRTPGINPYAESEQLDIFSGTSPDYTQPLLTFIQGLTSATTAFQSARQLSYNADVISSDIDARIEQETMARRANALRESQAGSRRLAQIESGYSVSGVEMSGDVANYVSKVAAVQERDIQQRNQDLYYKVQVMRVQQENMEMAAKLREKSVLIQAASSLIGGGINALTQKKEIDNYWENYGPVTTKKSPGQFGGLEGLIGG